jgi:predicted phage terminase large subunit-like protein
MTPSQQATEKVKAAIALARADLLEYAALCDRNYVVSRFHSILARKLESVAHGRTRRLIINVPPRHGKSRMTTVELPTWMLGQNPTKKIVLTSYSNNLASKHSKESRARLQSSLYRAMFPETQLNPRDAGADEWTTLKGGLYKATGIGGSLTGHGAELLIVDDPFKDFEEAHSPTMRENVWQWFLSTAYTRLSPEGAIVIIMTRWHQDDLVGRLLDPKRQQELKDAGVEDEAWEVLNLPALAHDDDPIGRAPGDALFPEKFPANRLRAIRQTLGSYLWAALYDGNPIPKGGNYVNGEHFIIRNRDEIPTGMRWMRFWDLATSSKTVADYTAGVQGAIGPAPGAPGNWRDDQKKWPLDYFYLRDMVFGQWEWPRAREKIKTTAELERVMVGVEAVSGFKTGYANLKEVMSAEIAMQDFGADKDKLTRALPWIAMTEARKVVLVAGDWIPSFKQQVEAFPTGANDDMVDAVSGVWNMLKSGRKILVS